MLKKIKIHQGVNLNIDGEAEKIIVDLPRSRTYGVKPDDFFTIVPKLLVKEGDKVKNGTPLFFSKKNPRINFVSPVSGIVTSIVRGPKRKILEIIITDDKKNDSVFFETASHEKLTLDEIKELILKSGFWPFIKQRPYDIISSPEDTPKSIFISCFSTVPLAVDYDFLLKNDKEDFQLGVNILKRLTSGDIFLGLDSAFNGFFKDIENVKKISVDGPHPSGNVGIQIHKIDPINYGDKVWTLNPEDVSNLGVFFRTGKFSSKRTIALVGNSVKKRQYYKTTIGTSISTILEFSGFDFNKNNRIINGDLLSGITSGPDSYLGYYNNLLSVLDEGNSHRFMGWIPFVDNHILSLSRTSLSWLFSKKKYNVNSNMNGEERAIVVTGEMEKVFPMDIYPMELIKACLNQDIEKMEALGIYEVAPEDFGLIDYASTSKIEAQEIIKSGIELMINEVG